MSNFSELSSQDFTLFLIILVFAIIILMIVRRLLKVPFPYFFIGLLGLTIGLSLGSLAAGPFANLPGQYGRWMPIIVDVFIAAGVLDLFLAQGSTAIKFFNRFVSRLQPEKMEDENFEKREVLMDTSVLIDGRIGEIIHTGFIFGKILIPQFILNELQNVADSSDPLKRAKGRKGLEVLDHIQHDQSIETEIIDEETISREAVDSRLIKLAKKKKAKILTVDFNLNKVAKIQGIEVLNINELAEAIKPVLIPGEDILVKIIQEGKEPGQGIGYLNDGTMIVVESGSSLLGQEIMCEVVRIFQTVAGKMIFVNPKKKNFRKKVV